MRPHLLLALLLLAASPLSADDWPAWRGPTANGYVTTDAPFPQSWSATENVLWHAKLPGPGNSTPIVVGRRVFYSCASRDGRRRSLICLDRRDGTTMWEQREECERDEPTHTNNPFDSSSPVSDGQRVVVWHGSAGLFAYDMDGTLLWQTNLGRFEHIWGTGSSPMIFEDLVIVNCGPGVHSFLVALDKRTGREQWRREFPGMAAHKNDDLVGSWSTPVVTPHDGQNSLLISLPTTLYALDPLSGTPQWFCEGLGPLVYSSPLVTEDVVVAMSGDQGPAMAVTPGGQGDVTLTHRIWLQNEKTPQRVGSGIIVDDCVYVLNEQGIAWCMELATGDILWKHRLSETPAWSSMCFADGRIYVTNCCATTYVLKPADTECLVLARNEIKERMGASLAFSDGQIFIRTHENLYCIEQARPQ